MLHEETEMMHGDAVDDGCDDGRMLTHANLHTRLEFLWVECLNASHGFWDVARIRSIFWLWFVRFGG